MAAAGEADRGHAGGAGGADARRTVLDDEAGGRLDGHFAGREEEQVRRGLAARNHPGAEHMRGETLPEAGQAEREP